MKTNLLQKKFLAILLCSAMMFTAKAITSTALSVSDLQTQFAAAVASGVPSTINIGAAIAVSADLPLVSTGDSITLNVTTFGITVSAGTLTIGNKVKVTSILGNSVEALAGGTVVLNAGCNIYSTATSPITAAGGNVIINGGKIATSNFPAASAGLAGLAGGTLTINGGYLSTSATSTARGVVVDYSGICIVNGGEIHSDMGGGRGISINTTNSGGKLYVNGGKISAAGAGRAIQLDNANSSLWVTGSPIITGGLEAIMVQKNGVAVIGGTPTLTGVIGTNVATAKLYDARGLSAIVATPGTGTYTGPQNVTLTGGTGTIYKYVNTTAQASATVVTSSLVYTTDGTAPVAASTAYSAPVAITATSTVNVSPLIELTTIGSPTVFTYTINASGISTVAANSVKCYPSQVIDRMNVTADTQISTINVLNMLGQSVKSFQVNSIEKSIDLSGVSAGNYFVTVKLANGQSATQKIVKL